MSKKNETKVLCPECGAEFAIAEKTVTTVATVIGKDAGIGIVYAEVVGKEPKLQKKLPKTAKERIEALREAGIDVSLRRNSQRPPRSASRRCVRQALM